jgi:AAA+ superfamily predicted ATPase
MDNWRNKGKAIIVLTPYVDIPLEIRKDFMMLEMPLPDEAEIRGCMHHISKSAGKPELLDAPSEPIVQAAKGLTKTEIENVLALSYTETGKFDVKTINEQKIQTIEKSGLIEVLRTDKTYDDIIGYDLAKQVIGKMIQKRTSKGCLFVGPPGCGKTAFMECTIGEFNKIGLLINFGRLYSKFQGEGFEQVEEVIDIIEAVGDCIVVMDETLSI